MKYDNEQLTALCEKFDLLEYVSDRYEMVQTGQNFYCTCPLHKEKTASMCVNDNHFYCFGCGQKGGPIDWFRKVEHLSFNDSVDKLAKLTGSNIEHLKTCDALAYYKSVKRQLDVKKEKKVEHEILSPDYYDQFSNELPQEWIDEGISQDTMRKYEIRIDNKSKRIVYPVYDNNLHFIGVKGRTRLKSFKDLKIAKYMNYKTLGTTDFFMGMKQNKSSILSSKSVIIFEGIKSCMKAEDYGYHNTLASETSCLNEEQVNILLQMGLSNVCIAYDSDVPMEKILHCTKILRKFTNVYVVRNKRGLLKDKESPVDEGKEVWEELFNERVKI